MQSLSFSYFRQHWQPFTWHVCKQTIAWVGVFLATYSAAVTIAPTGSQTQVFLSDFTAWLLRGWPLLFFVVVLGALSAWHNWPRMRAVFHDPRTGVKVIIENCDIFRQEGIKVIHSVDTFDTELNTIITPRSLHGAFLGYCQQQKTDLDAQLQAALRHVEPAATDEQLPGRKMRYPLGTLCKINVGNEPFGLVAFSHLQPNGSISISRQEYTEFLGKLWDSLAKPNMRQEVVNVAVMGNRFLDLPTEFTTEQKIDIMLQTFFVYSRKSPCCKTLRICVHDSNALDIDFHSYPVIMRHLSQRPELQF